MCLLSFDSHQQNHLIIQQKFRTNQFDHLNALKFRNTKFGLSLIAIISHINKLHKISKCIEVYEDHSSSDEQSLLIANKF